MPSCPPGTVQVGIISVKGPDGEEGCVICKDCETPQNPDCFPLDCCTPAQIEAGRECKLYYITRFLFENGTSHEIRPQDGNYTIQESGPSDWIIYFTNQCGFNTFDIVQFAQLRGPYVVDQQITTSCLDCSSPGNPS